MRRDLILHDLPDFFQGYGLTRSRDYTGTDGFAQDRVGGGDDANLFNFRVVNEHAFKFMGIYLISAAVNQVLGAAVYFHIAVFIPRCQITHVQPPIDNLFAGFGRMFPITLHDMPAGEGQFSNLTIFQLLVRGRIHNPHAGISHRLANVHFPDFQRRRIGTHGSQTRSDLGSAPEGS